MPRARTTHLRHDDPTLTLCGEAIESAAWRDDRLAVADSLLDADKPCKKCQRLDAEREPPFVSGPAVRAIFGARVIAESSARAADAVRREVVEDRPIWPSAEAAARSYVRERREREMFGIAMRSTADPRDRVQSARDPSLGGREHAQIDRHRTVSLAMRLAMEMPLALNAACPTIGPDDARWVYELAVGGRAFVRCTRHRSDRDRADCNATCGTRRFVDWTPIDHESAAEKAKDHRAIVVSPWEVTQLFRVFSAVVRCALLESGELGGYARPAREWDPAARIREAG